MGASEKTTAVVMGLTETGLAVARSLGRRGIKTIGVNPSRSPASFSSFLHYIREPKEESEKLAFYLGLAKKIGHRAVLLPTGDPNVLFLSRHRDLLGQHFAFFIPSRDTLAAITSKRQLIRTATALDLPLPRSILLKTGKEAESLPPEFFPCVLKPEFTHLWRSKAAYRAGINKAKAIPAHNKGELLALLDRFTQVDPRILIQQMIVGPDANHLDYHALVEEDGSIRAEFVGQKLRLTPPKLGMGCYVQSIRSEEVVAAGRRVLSRLDYRGLANINFKRDERDGKLYLLEINPRFSFWVGLDVACGIDFPYYYYQLCLEEPYAADSDYPIGKRWLSLRHDLKGMKTYKAKGELTWGQWAASALRPTVGALFACDDPLPALVCAAQSVTRPFENRLRRLLDGPGPTRLEKE